MSKRMYHPCHKLSVPSAKIFWCRHCMQMFEDAISRWKHSRICHACPTYRQTNKDAKFIQMYVKPDTVSYTLNKAPGEGVFHKPQVKKTSAALKCMICDSKFDTVYDMREHVKYPCQRNTFLISQKSIDKIEEEEGVKGHIKIRRIETEDDILAANTSLSVLAEASKHVESLAKETPIEEEVIEEQVEEYITETTGDSFTVDRDSILGSVCGQKVVIAYPRVDIARPELGKVSLALQGDNGTDLPDNFLTADLIQECLRDTAKKLPIGQIIEVILNSERRRTVQFVVGSQGSLLPYYSKPTPDYIELRTAVVDNTPESYPNSTKEATEINSATTNLQKAEAAQPEVLVLHDSTFHDSALLAENQVKDSTLDKSAQFNSNKGTLSTLEQILTGHLDVHILQGGRIELVKNPVSVNNPSTIQQEEIVYSVETEPTDQISATETAETSVHQSEQESIGTYSELVHTTEAVTGEQLLIAGSQSAGEHLLIAGSQSAGEHLLIAGSHSVEEQLEVANTYDSENCEQVICISTTGEETAQINATPLVVADLEGNTVGSSLLPQNSSAVLTEHQVQKASADNQIQLVSGPSPHELVQKLLNIVTGQSLDTDKVWQLDKHIFDRSIVNNAIN